MKNNILNQGTFILLGEADYVRVGAEEDILTDKNPSYIRAPDIWGILADMGKCY